MLNKRLDRFIRAAERMRLEEFVRYSTNRRARLLDAFWQGVMRGLGAMVGFSILGAVVIYLLQLLAQRNLPVIGEFIARVVSMVKLRID